MGARLVNPSRPKANALVDINGVPFAPFGRPAHDAASRASAELASWQPNEHTADSAILPELGTLRARTNDIIRNHGLMSGAVQIHLDNVIGTGLRLNAKPNWRALGVTDKQVMADWEREAEAKFNTWAEDPDCYCDASRRLTFAGILAQGYRSYLTNFEIVGTAEWLPDRPGSKYATAIQMLPPARLCSPNNVRDSKYLRAGVELDDMGAPVAYYFVSDTGPYPYSDAAVKQWKKVNRETSWGRRMVLHHFDNDEPGQTRGKSGIVSVLSKIKMLEKFEQAHLQAAILNAMYAAVIQSNMDTDNIGAALGTGAGDPAADPLTAYMGMCATWHQESNIRYNGVKIPHLFAGEELKLMAPQHPNAAFAQFEETVIRHIAAGLNLSYEQLSRDYSKSNYSSSRAAMLEGWRFFNGKQAFIAGPFATQVYALWLEEAFDNGEIELPAGAPEFWDAKSAWTKCQWIGPGRSHIDPEKDANASKMEYSLGLTTLEKEAAARGENWEDLLEQRAQEHAKMVELGMDPKEFQAAAVGAQPTPPAKEDNPRDNRQGVTDAGQSSAVAG